MIDTSWPAIQQEASELTLSSPSLTVTVISAGAMPVGGTKTFSINAPGLGLAGGALGLYVQAAFVDASPATWVGGAVSLLILDL